MEQLEAELTSLWVLICAFFVFQVCKFGLIRCFFCDGCMFCDSCMPTWAVAAPACSPLQMQSGFALLEAGSVRSKNTKNILLKVRGPSCFC